LIASDSRVALENSAKEAANSAMAGPESAKTLAMSPKVPTKSDSFKVVKNFPMFGFSPSFKSSLTRSLIKPRIGLALFAVF